MRKPTNKQKAVMEQILAKPSISKRKAMINAGYSPNTAVDPSNLENTEGWKMLMEQYFPDNKLAQRVSEGLDAVKQISARIIMQKNKNEPGNQDAYSRTDDFVEVEDYAVRHKYVETALKLKNRFPDNTLKLPDDIKSFRLILDVTK